MEWEDFQGKSVSDLGIIGIGGCGANVVSDLTREFDSRDYRHLYALAVNTDAAQLDALFNPMKQRDNSRLQEWERENPRLQGKRQLEILIIGEDGKGAGMDPEIGRAAAEKNLDAIGKFLEPLSAVIIQAGLGKGTGTGGSPIIAQKAVEMGIPTIAVVTMPFPFELYAFWERAVGARKKLLNICPTITICNGNLPDKNVSVGDAWKQVNRACIIPMMEGLRTIIQDVG